MSNYINIRTIDRLMQKSCSLKFTKRLLAIKSYCSSRKPQMTTKCLLVVCLLGLLAGSLALQQNVNILKQLEEDPSDIAYSIYNAAKQIVSGELKSLNVLEYVNKPLLKTSDFFDLMQF